MGIVGLLAAIGCTDAQHANDDAGLVGWEAPTLPQPERTRLAVDPLDDFSGLEGLSCARMESCAPRPSVWLGETCCAWGPPITVEHTYDDFDEGVHVDADGDVVAMCTGQGGLAGAVDEMGALDPFPATVPRCQETLVGPEQPDGTRVVYYAHHGDSLDPRPRLWAMQRAPEGKLTPLDDLGESNMLYEGMALAEDGTLWVGVHNNGLRSYALQGDGTFRFYGALGGFDNASKVAIHGDVAFVLDLDRVVAVDVSDREEPVWLSDVPTEGQPRDVVADDEHVLVALGVGGVQVFERGEAGALSPLRVIDVGGSAQTLDMDERVVGVAAWDHLALFERRGFARIGGLRLLGSFEQSWGIALGSDYAFGMEWNGLTTLALHPGQVLPEVSVDKELLAFTPDGPGQAVLRLRNRGPLNALIHELVSNDEALSLSSDRTRVLPGGAATVQVSFAPPLDDEQLSPAVGIVTNDPDRREDPLIVPVSVRDTEGIDVGDRLPDDFAFLDPGGDLENLEGQVMMLAYFALF
ncbi:MAG: hypothetical protein KTR31_29210 [Myxococcales bacterium]|nr:hypothetical protein [Myxococcales bacterium]